MTQLYKYNHLYSLIVTLLVGITCGDQSNGVRRTKKSASICWQDTVEDLGAMGTSAVDDFDWLVQLRYYVEAHFGLETNRKSMEIVRRIPRSQGNRTCRGSESLADTAIACYSPLQPDP